MGPSYYDVQSPDKNGRSTVTRMKQERDTDIERQTKNDFSALLELMDILDELHTIRELFKEQREVLSVMARPYIGEPTGETQIPVDELATHPVRSKTTRDKQV